MMILLRTEYTFLYTLPFFLILDKYQQNESRKSRRMTLLDTEDQKHNQKKYSFCHHFFSLHSFSIHVFIIQFIKSWIWVMVVMDEIEYNDGLVACYLQISTSINQSKESDRSLYSSFCFVNNTPLLFILVHMLSFFSLHSPYHHSSHHSSDSDSYLRIPILIILLIIMIHFSFFVTIRWCHLRTSSFSLLLCIWIDNFTSPSFSFSLFHSSHICIWLNHQW